MAASVATSDYLSGRNGSQSRPAPQILRASTDTPRTPRTPLLGRSISSQFGSPGGFRTEPEDVIVYELDPRFLAAGYAGESRPRCIVPFSPDAARRVGDYRQFDADYVRRTRSLRLDRAWGQGFELYTNDLRGVDLGLVEDKMDRALRTAQIDHLQIDLKPRKVALVVPPMAPTAVLEIALKVLFAHFTQPPSITILSSSIMCCASAGLRDALVVDIGWQETVVTAVGEYREVAQRRSIRAGKRLTWNLAQVINEELKRQDLTITAGVSLTFDEAEDLSRRMAWCRTAADSENAGTVQLSIPGSTSGAVFSVAFDRLSEPVESSFFTATSPDQVHDDDDLPISSLAYSVLLSLPVDLRASCLRRIVISGYGSDIPGLKQRLLRELSRLQTDRGWDAVSNYGSATQKREKLLQERSANIVLRPKPPESIGDGVSFSPMKMPLQESVPHAERIHDDVRDPVTLKAERGSRKGPADPLLVRGVATLGAWAGASLMASLRVKGLHEIERDDFLKSGARTIDGVR